MERILKVGALLTLVCLALACGSSDGATGPGNQPPPPPPPSNPEAAAINAYVSSLTDWPKTVPAQRSPVTRSPVFLEEAYPGGDVIDYKCDLSGKNLVRTFPKLLAMGSDFGAIYPGALIEGASARSGRPTVIPIARAPLTIRINLAVSQQAKRVTDVNSVSMLQAVADLQRSAAGEQGMRNVVPADMVFELAEANTFEQSMTAIGVSLGYATPLQTVGANLNIDGRTSRAVRTQSVVVKFVQEMFTVRVADDLQPQAADLFAPNVRASDIQALAASGKIGPNNLPLYVESITYGRVMLFSMKSTDVATADELKQAMSASGRGFNGSATLTQRQKTILSSANYQFVVFGGPQSAATAAIASLDWSKYFVPATAETAVPIAITVKTLKGRETATIYDDVAYDERGGCREPASYGVDVTLTRVERTSGFCLACSFTAEIRQPGQVIPTIMRTGVFGPSTGPMTFSDRRSVSLAPGQKFDLCSLFDTGGFCMPFGYPGAVAASLNNMKLMNNAVNTTFTSAVNAAGAAGKFTYTVRKTANFL